MRWELASPGSPCNSHETEMLLLLVMVQQKESVVVIVIAVVMITCTCLLCTVILIQLMFYSCDISSLQCFITVGLATDRASDAVSYTHLTLPTNREV